MFGKNSKRYPLTKVVLDTIKELEQSLPKTPKIQSETEKEMLGQFVKKWTRVKGSDLNEKQRKILNDQFDKIKQDAKENPEKYKGKQFPYIDSEKHYLFYHFEPVYMNHAVELRAAYQKRGEPGLVEYIARVNKIASKLLKPAEEKVND